MYELGQILKVQYTGFLHYGIYTGNNRVIHNSKNNNCVEETSLGLFADNKDVEISSIKAKNPSLAVQTAKKYLGVPYHLFSENCEHFVRTVCSLEKESTQVQKYLISALSIGVCFKSEDTLLKAASGGAGLATLLTPTEQSPVKNAVVAACLALGIAYLASK